MQKTWLRLNDADATQLHNLGGWLTTVMSRVCLDMLRVRKRRREEPADAALPAESSRVASRSDPEQEAMMADAVGLALLVVLDTLSPAERVAFVLHEVQRAEVAWVDGSVGVVLAPGGKLSSVVSVTIERGRVARLDIIADPARLEGTHVGAFTD